MDRLSGGRRVGFTLIEILVVVIILGILAGLVIPRIMEKPGEARQTTAKLQLESLEAAINLFKLENGFFPSTEQGLEALVRKPTTGRIPTRWQDGGYLRKPDVPQGPVGAGSTSICARASTVRTST